MTDESHLPTFKGGMGKWYKALVKVEINDKQTPYTPSVVYTHSRHSRAEVWKTEAHRPRVFKAVLKHNGASVTIKSLKSTEGNLALRNEADVLNRLEWIDWLPLFQVAPRLYEYLKFDQTSHRWFIAFEWFDIEKTEEGYAWENLQTILKKGPLPTNDLLDLHRSLYKAMRIIHILGVFHGDLKDEHVLIKVKNVAQDQYDFSKIRLIDFGLSYLDQEAEWRGASLGFCSPYFWHPEHRELNPNSIMYLDYYSVDALLYYALTGECFPVTSPAYYEITGTKDDCYCGELKDSLLAKWIDEPEPPRKALAGWLLNRLCNYDPGRTIFRDSFYRREILSISRDSAWWFVGTLLILNLLLQPLFVGEWPRIVLSLILLAGIRWWKQKGFVLLDQQIQEKIDKPTLFWLLPILLSIGGAWILPALFYPAIPVIVGLFVNSKKNAFFASVGVGLLAGAYSAWLHLTLNADSVGMANWSIGLKAGPVGLITILFSWAAAFTLVSLRFRISQWFKREQLARLLLVALSTLVAWLTPSVVGIILLIPTQFSPTFWYTGILSLILALISVLFAYWEYLK